MINEGKTSQEITERFAQELLKVQEEVREREKRKKKEKEKEEKLAALLGQINEIMYCYFSELYTPELYNEYISKLDNFIYTIVKDMYLESAKEEEEEENKNLTF